jgi:mannose-1-phosphate guanylyltransferase
MKALLLIGGQATRLWPLNRHLAKSLLPVCDRELLLYQVSQLAYAGIKDIVLATGGAHVEQLIDYCAAFGGGVTFHFSLEHEPLGTAGAIANASHILAGDSVLVLNADILSDVRIADVVQRHFDSGRKATLVGYPVPDPSRYGLLLTRDDEAITGFSEKPEGAVGPGPHYINAGVYVLHPDAVAAIPSWGSVSIERETFPQLIESAGELTLYPHRGLWVDIGTFESYFHANFTLIGRRYTFGEDQLWGQRSDCSVFKDFVYINKRVALGQGADLYHRVAVMRDCAIGKDVKLRDALLLPGAQVGDGARLESCLVGPGVRIEPGAQVAHMLLVAGEEPQPFYPLADAARG